jgi:hypothetical protein
MRRFQALCLMESVWEQGAAHLQLEVDLAGRLQAILQSLDLCLQFLHPRLQVLIALRFASGNAHL